MIDQTIINITPMIIISILLTLLQPQQDTLAARYIDRHQLCNTIQVSNRYMALSFTNETDFTMYYSVSGGLESSSFSKYYRGKYEIKDGYVTLFPVAEDLATLNEVKYKIEGTSLIRVSNSLSTEDIFPFQLKEEKIFEAEYDRRVYGAPDTTARCYFKKSQVCSVIFAIDYNWEIRLKADNIFVLTETVTDSRSHSLNILEKNKSPYKNHKWFTSGSWEQKGDTVNLKVSYSTKYLLISPSDKYSFIESNGCLKAASGNKEKINLFPLELCINQLAKE